MATGLNFLMSCIGDHARWPGADAGE